MKDAKQKKPYKAPEMQVLNMQYTCPLLGCSKDDCFGETNKEEAAKQTQFYFLD